MFTLITALIYLALLVADEYVGNEVPSLGFTLLILLPSLAVTVRCAGCTTPTAPAGSSS